MEFLSRWLARWPIALLCVALLAGVTLLPGLGTFGIWEPQERQLADKVAPREELAKKQAETAPKPPPPPKDGCYRVPPDDALARTLGTRVMKLGRDEIDDSDAGRRLPFALLGLLAVLATAGIAMRAGGTRAGLLAALIVLAMPLLSLQSRQLTSEIGTATSGALIIYGLFALATLRGRGLVLALDAAVAVLALVAGSVLGFVAGGALLGLLVPFGAFAVAGMLGVPAVIDLCRALRNGALTIGRRIVPRFAVGREPSGYTGNGNWPALIATLVTIAVVSVLAYQLFSLVRPMPGAVPPQRALFGKAIVPSGCWSSWLGALWRPEDDLRYSFDSTFEQIGYGTFPWGIVGVVAIASLIANPDRKRTASIGQLALAWAAAGWIGCEVFQRKVGFTLYPAFPALAIAAGVWVDDLVARRVRGDREVMPRGALLVGLCVAFAVLVLGKDMQSFAERISSLLVGGDQVTYPTMSTLLFLKTRLWILILGLYVGVGFALAMMTWRDVEVPSDPRSVAVRTLLALVYPIGIFWVVFVLAANRATKLRVISEMGVVAAIAGTVAFAAFWPFVWQPKLAVHLSSKAMFDLYTDLQKPGDQLVIMGDMGDAPHDYAPAAKPEIVTTRDQIVQAIGRPNRVFAIAPQTELCQLHREIGGKPYFVLDDRNTRSLLLSNRVDGTSDKNPLRTAILHAEPKQIQSRPKARVVFDGRIELLGWTIPKVVGRGDRLEVKMVYKILQPVGGNWRVLFHIDGPIRINGDHEPIAGRCQTSTWQPGDFIVDTFSVTAGGTTHAKGPYEIWTGFFTGQNPNWKNMTVSEAPADMRDQAERVKITTITLD